MKCIGVSITAKCTLSDENGKDNSCIIALYSEDRLCQNDLEQRFWWRSRSISASR